MEKPYFPIRLQDMPAKMNFEEIKIEEDIQIGRIAVKSASELFRAARRSTYSCPPWT